MFCQGSPLDLARLNLNLRTGERVLLVLGSFPAADFDALFEGTRALPWERFIPREGQFPVKGHSLNSALHSVPACQSIVKKAVAARLGAKYGLNTLAGDRGPLPGAVLHYGGRGRPDAGHLRGGAPQAGIPGPGGGRPPAGDPGGGHGAPVPVTGGGTPCATPSADLGPSLSRPSSSPKNRAPGLNRTFSAQKWAFVDKKLWLQAADEAMDKEFPWGL